MTEEERKVKLAEWIASRPECVQKLAREFPIGESYVLNGNLYHLIGWTEDDKLILTPINPNQDYEKAMEKKIYLCAIHVREGRPGYDRRR